MNISPQTIICLHGLASSSAAFDELIKSESLSDYNFTAPDYAGHVKALEDTYEGDPLAFVADKISGEIKNSGHKVILVGHSMGGALALLIMERVPEYISAVISIEGNLIGEDSGYISRRTASAPSIEVVSGIKNQLIETTSKSASAGWQAWAKDLASISDKAFRDYAASLVTHSDSGNLIKTFNAFKGPKAYIYGDDYVDHAVLKRMDGIPAHYVRGAGHFVMQDEPDITARLIRQTLSGAS